MSNLVEYVYHLPNIPKAGIGYVYQFLRTLGIMRHAKISHFKTITSTEPDFCTVDATFHFPPGSKLKGDDLFPLVLFRTENTSKHALCVWLLVKELTNATMTKSTVDRSRINHGLRALKNLQSYPDFDDVARTCVGQFADKLMNL